MKYCAGWSPLKIGVPSASASPPANWAPTVSDTNVRSMSTANSIAVYSPGPSGGSVNGLTTDEKPNHVAPGNSGLVPAGPLEPAPASSAAVVAALGGFLFGYDSAVINGAVAAVESTFKADPIALGFAVASALIGAAVGALLAGRLADRVGRLAVMKIAAVLFLVSAIVTGLAPDLWILVAGRIIGSRTDRSVCVLVRPRVRAAMSRCGESLWKPASIVPSAMVRKRTVQA